MKSKLVPASHSAAQRQYIQVDASVHLPMDNPIANLDQGDLFGEQTCLNFYPRSATVRASNDTVVLEMLRNVLQMLLKNKEFKSILDAKYRARMLDHHLRSVPLFKDMPADFIEHLRNHVELVSFDEGAVICKEGDIADALYFVKTGLVKVSQMYPGGEVVRTYLSPGQYFGEIGLLHAIERTATCTATVRSETVRIKKQDFDLMVERFPAVRAELERVAQERLASNKQSLEPAFSSDSVMQRLLEAGESVLILDLEKCTRCDDCVHACASAHDGYSRLQRLGERIDDQFLLVTSCNQCRDPRCMTQCPVSSMLRLDSGQMTIKDWCIGCGACAKNCPYDNITMHTMPPEMKKDPHTGEVKEVVTKKATVCNLCQDQAEPACVYACPHGAAVRVDPKEFFQLQTIGAAFPDKSN